MTYTVAQYGLSDPLTPESLQERHTTSITAFSCGERGSLTGECGYGISGFRESETLSPPVANNSHKHYSVSVKIYIVLQQYAVSPRSIDVVSRGLFSP